MTSDSLAGPLILSGTCTVGVKFGTWAHAETATRVVLREVCDAWFSPDRPGGVATPVSIACKGMFVSAQNGAVADPLAAGEADQKCDVRVRCAHGGHRDVPLKCASFLRGRRAACDDNRIAGDALPLVSQTSVPLTCATVPVLPIVFPAANTRPWSLNSIFPCVRSTVTCPPCADHGPGTPVTAPVPLPTMFPPWMMPITDCQRATLLWFLHWRIELRRLTER